MSDAKLYSQKEIRALLKRATELQQKEIGKTEEGLSLEELEEIAQDSGIDPVYIREAISEQRMGVKEESKFHFLGGPASLEIGREVPYRLDQDDWELVVQEARKTFRKSGGTVQNLGKSLEWVSPDLRFIQVSLTVSPSKEKTRFFVSSHFEKVAFLFYYIPSVILLVTLSVTLGTLGFSALSNILIIIISMLSVFGGLRFLFGRWVKFQRKKLNKMISRFEQIISSSDKKAKSSSSDHVQQPSIIIPPEESQENNVTLKQRGKTRT